MAHMFICMYQKSYSNKIKSQTTWVPVRVLLFTKGSTMDKLPDLFKDQFPYLENGVIAMVLISLSCCDY